MPKAIVARSPVPTVDPVTLTPQQKLFPSIRHTIIGGTSYFAVGDVSFASVRQAATALSAAESHRLDIIDYLTVARAVAFTEMRDAGSDLLRFRAASKREAFLAAQIRQLRANADQVDTALLNQVLDEVIADRLREIGAV